MPYFGEPVGRVKKQTTSKNSQRYYTTKRLIRDLLSNKFYVRMRDRSMRSGTELAREIQLTDWSTTNKPVLPVLWSANTAWYLYSSWALFVLYELEVQLDNKYSYLMYRTPYFTTLFIVMLLQENYRPLIFVSISRSLMSLYGEAPLDRASDTKSSRKDNDSSTCKYQKYPEHIHTFLCSLDRTLQG